MAPGSAKETKTKLFFPGCEIAVIGGDQHVIQWAYHETVNQLIDDFIWIVPENNTRWLFRCKIGKLFKNQLIRKPYFYLKFPGVK